MKSELNQILESKPRKVLYKEIVDFDNFYERLSALSVLFKCSVVVCENYIEFCPDNKSPIQEEELSWIWIFRPDLADELLKLELSEDFRMLINSFSSS